MIEVYAYNAGKGDCIRVRFGSEQDYHNIFIDTGVTRFGPTFRSILADIQASGETLDLLILTHVDDDHIGGILSLLRNGWVCQFQEVRMNRSGEACTSNTPLSNIPLSTRQNNEVYSYLQKQNILVKSMIAEDEINAHGAVIKVLWPKTILIESERNDTPLAYHRDYGYSLSELAGLPIKASDHSINNRNSVICTVEYEQKKLLFTGDAWGEDIVAAVTGDDLQHFDLMKLPHHGAVGNLSERFPESIHCSDFLICTDGIMHPDKQTIAKLISWYGKINIFSPSDWWSKDFFVEEDLRDSSIHDSNSPDSSSRLNINLMHREGLVIRW